MPENQRRNRTANEEPLHRFVREGDAFFAYSNITFDSLIADEVITPGNTSQNLGAVDMNALNEANKRIHLQQVEQRNRARRDVDERESAYRDSFLQNKGASAPSDIVSSELPLCVDYYAPDTIKEIVQLGHPDVFSNKTKSVFRCASCSRDLPRQYMYFCLGRVYCAEHVPQVEVCGVCLYPKEETKLITTFDKREINVCARCRENGRRCSDCNQEISEADVVERRCVRCRAARSNNAPTRPWSHELTYASDSTAGKIVKSPRMFSTEVELLLPASSRLITDFSRRIPNEIGVSQDGSIRGGGVGIEIQTPRLIGKQGEALVEKVCDEINIVSGKVNDSCGMHIHLDGSDLVPKSRREYPKALLALWSAHLAFEDVILSLVPFQRRFNRYSRPMRPYFTTVELEAVESIMEAESLWYRQRSSRELREAKNHHYHSSRYFGINLHPLFAHGHLEVRYHPGTTNSKKILEWANLHALIVDAAVAGKFTPEVLQEAQVIDLGSKTNFLFDLIGLSKESRAYFYDRQRKFRNRAQKEDGTVDIGRDRRATTAEELQEDNDSY